MPYQHNSNFFNRDLSWIEFNARVLEESFCLETPLLEKVKFLAIFTGNFDEFFMVRVAGLKSIVDEDLIGSDSPDNMNPKELLGMIRERSTELIQRQYQFFNSHVIPELRKNQVYICRMAELAQEERAKVQKFFDEQIYPILTPLAIDPSHPFPLITNNVLYLVVCLDPSTIDQKSTEHPIGLVEIPEFIPRLIPASLEDGKYTYVMVEDLIIENMKSLFIGCRVKDIFQMRATRNLDYNLLESEVVDLLKSVERKMVRREQQEIVRLEVSHGMSPVILEKLKKALEVDERFIYHIPGPLNLKGFIQLTQLPLPHLKDPAFNPRMPARLAGNEDIFSLIAKKDLMLHLPFESFFPVIEFLQTAAYDSQVLSIKQTLYRTSGDSPIIEALIQAAENGKHVTAIIELKARFDEKNNIEWARRLEKAGVTVVFGFIGLKTHAKAAQVVRKEGDKIVRYTHLSTGNYNSSTAKSYTDIGLFTVDEQIGADISVLFNLLTGFNILTGDGQLQTKISLPPFHKILLAPINLRQKLLEEIDREIAFHKEHHNGRIVAKMNALVDYTVISKLYEASKAGVKVQLVVRGTCCLRPGVLGLSENISVISIVDRFLEHSRLYCFHNNGARKTFLSSADWMPRNMVRRIEIAFPVSDVDVKERLLSEVFPAYFEDNVKAWSLQSDGTYRRLQPQSGEPAKRAQQKFIDLARAAGLKTLPYEHTLRKKEKKVASRPVAKKQKSKN